MSYINTIADLEAQTYGTGATGQLSNDLLKAAGTVSGIHGGHGNLGLGNTTGLYNQIYGQKVWSMLNRECNALSIIAKRPYTSSGWRVLSDRPAGGSGNKLDLSLANATDIDGGTDALLGGETLRADYIGGVPENARLDTRADGLVPLQPTYSVLFTSPKVIAHQFNFSELSMEMAAIDDGIGDIRAQMREDMGKHHAEVQNQMLVMPLEDYDPKTAYATPANRIDLGYTSLYKVITSTEELTEMAANGGNSLTAAADATAISHIYGTHRDAGSFLDSQVSFGAGYLSAEARPMTLTVLNAMIRDIRVNGGSPKVILTGYDTLQTLSDLLQAQERFMDRKEIVPTVNGVRGVKGSEVGFRVSTYYDIPLIPVAAMPSTGKNGDCISDLLFLDTDHLWLSVMKPTQYFEDGISNGNPFGVGTLGNKALYRTMGEVGCSYFKGQGKITNLL